MVEFIYEKTFRDRGSGFMNKIFPKGCLDGWLIYKTNRSSV